MYLQRKLLVTLKLGALLRVERSFLQYYSRKCIVCIRVSSPLRKTTPVFHQVPEGEKCNPPLPPCKKSHSSFPATSSKNWDLVKPSPLFFLKIWQETEPSPQQKGRVYTMKWAVKAISVGSMYWRDQFFHGQNAFFDLHLWFCKGFILLDWWSPFKYCI